MGGASSLPPVSGEGRGLGGRSVGGLEELSVRRAEMAEAYEEDMWNRGGRRSPSTAEDGPGTQGESCKKKR